MWEFPGFGALLVRLLDYRRSGVGALSKDAGVPEGELRSVVDGARPTPALLRALAPALNWHAADLFVMAGRPVPDTLAPLDASAGRSLRNLVKDVVCLPADQRSQVRRLVQSLPQEPRRDAYRPHRVDDPHEGGFGAMVANMLYSNRNLDPQGVARALALCSDGRMYVSPSAITQIGAGRVELTAERLADLATVLDIPAGDLAAITGLRFPDGKPPEDPAAADVAALLWEVQRLSAPQVRQICEQAVAIRRELPSDAIDREFYAAGSSDIV